MTQTPAFAPAHFHMLRITAPSNALIAWRTRVAKPFRQNLKASHRFVAKLAEQHISEPLDASSTSLCKCRVFDHHQPVPYQDGWAMQHELVNEMKKDSDASDALVLLEHEPVYTLGTASKVENVLFDADELRFGQTPHQKGLPMLVRTERGGEVTYHGPGQLVAYPILNLNRHKKDLHWYLRSLEDVVIDMVEQNYGLTAGRKDGLTGVWVGDVKICAMGLKVSKWITMHGLALNVKANLEPFKRIIPCGISEHGVSSLHLLAQGRDISMQDAKRQLIESFSRVFGPYDLDLVSSK